MKKRRRYPNHAAASLPPAPPEMPGVCTVGLLFLAGLSSAQISLSRARRAHFPPAEAGANAEPKTPQRT